MLCTQTDIETLRQIDFSIDDDPKVAALIRHAEGILEGLTNRRFERVVDQASLGESLAWGVDGMLWVPQYPLESVSIVDSTGSTVPSTSYLWRETGEIVPRSLSGLVAETWTWEIEPFRSPARLMRGTVTYTAGPLADASNVPQDLRTICAQLAADLFDMGQASASGGAGIRQESLGDFSVTYQAAAGNLTDQQREALRKYTRRQRSIATI